MSQEEVLSLVARARDEATGPLRKVRDSLRQLKDGAEGPKELHKHFKELHEQIGKVREAVNAGISPALQGLGVSSVAATLSLGGLVEMLKSFAERGATLADMSRHAQLTVNTIRGFEGAGDKFGIGSDKMDAALENLTSKMQLFRKQWGDLYGAVHLFRPEEAKGLVATKESVEGNEEALKRWLKLLDNVRQKQGYVWARKFEKEQIGSDVFVDLLQQAKGFEGAWKAIRESIAKSGPIDPEQGKRTQEAFHNLSEAFEHIRNAAANSALPDFTKALNGLADFIQAHGDGITTGLKGIAGALTLVSGAAALRGLASLAGLRAGAAAGSAGGAGAGAAGAGFLAGLARFWSLPVLAGATAESTPDEETRKRQADFYREHPDASASIFGYIGKWWKRHSSGSAPAAEPSMPEPMKALGDIERQRRERAKALEQIQNGGSLEGETEAERRNRLLMHPESYRGSGSSGARVIQASYGGSLEGAASPAYDRFVEAIKEGTAAGVFKGLMDFAMQREAQLRGAAIEASLGGGGGGGIVFGARGGLRRGHGGHAGAAGIRAHRAGGGGNFPSGKDPKSGGEGPSGSALWDAIFKGEGTAGPSGFNTTYAHGKFGSGDLEHMTLRQVLELGAQTKARSGAAAGPMGKFQVVGKTMRAAAAAMGMDLDKTVYDKATQWKFGEWIMRNQGPGAWAGLHGRFSREAINEAIAIAHRRATEGAGEAGPDGGGHFSLPPTQFWPRYSIMNQKGFEGMRWPKGDVGDILRKGSDAGLGGGGPTKVEGTGTLHVKVEAPHGTYVKAGGGGLFREVHLNRGFAMTPASETA